MPTGEQSIHPCGVEHSDPGYQACPEDPDGYQTCPELQESIFPFRRGLLISKSWQLFETCQLKEDVWGVGVYSSPRLPELRDRALPHPG